VHGREGPTLCEELLFRGFLLTVLVGVLRSRAVPRAEGWAVLIAAVAFGVGHLGNLGTVPSVFLLVQVLSATVFGLVSGWIRLRTSSIVGPVLCTSC